MNTPRIGIINLPSLASLLTRAGYEVITGEDFRAAATAIRASLDAHGPFPLVISDTPWPGIRAWTNKAASDTDVTVVRIADPSARAPREFENVREVTPPVAVADILAPLRYGLHESLGDPHLGRTGEVVSAAAAADAPPVVPDPLGPAEPHPAQTVAEEPPAAVESEPQPIAHPTEVPAVEVVDDPWGAATTPDAAQPVTEQAPVTVPAQEPEPADVTSPQAAQPFATEDDPWGAPTVEVPDTTQDHSPAPGQDLTPGAAEVEATQEPVAATPSDPTAPLEAPHVEEPRPYGRPGAHAREAALQFDPSSVQAFIEPVAEPVQPVTVEEHSPAPSQDAPHPELLRPSVEEPRPTTPSQSLEPAQPVVQHIAEPGPDPIHDPDPGPQPVDPAVIEPSPAPRANVEQPPPARQGPVVVNTNPEFVAPAGFGAEPGPDAVDTAQPQVRPVVAPAPVLDDPLSSGIAEPSAILDPRVAQANPQPPPEQVQPVERVEPVRPAAPEVAQLVQPAIIHSEAPRRPAEGIEHPSESPSLPSSQAMQGAGADVIVAFAGKGGVGKTTTSAGLAQRAAEAGLRVVLVDGNFGQGDIRTVLRLGAAALPSIYNFATTGNVRAALIDPDSLNKARDLKAEPLAYAVVQAPPPHLADPNLVTPDIYIQLVAELRRMCDLVVIDTQIIEAVDTSGMRDTFIGPLLASGAWGVGLTDISSMGITNLLTTLKWLAARGVPQDHIVTMLTRVPNDLEYNREGLIAALGEHSTFVGAVYADTAIPETMNRGRGVGSVPSLAAVLDGALAQVRPDVVTAPGGEQDAKRDEKPRRRLFGRKRR